MEMVFAVAGIDLKLVFLVVDLESAIGDAVGETARRLARTRAVVERSGVTMLTMPAPISLNCTFAPLALVRV